MCAEESHSRLGLSQERGDIPQEMQDVGYSTPVSTGDWLQVCLSFPESLIEVISESHIMSNVCGM